MILSSACSVVNVGGSLPPTLNVASAVAHAQTGTAFAKPRTATPAATLKPPLAPAGTGLEGVQPTEPTDLPAQTESGDTPTPSIIPIATLSPTPTLHPMTIAWLREKAYPGSDITIVNALDPGANYSRYYASYESDGLTIYGLLTIPEGEMPSGGWPAIVFNHGYIPPSIYRTTERYIAYVDALARAGYVIFRIDYRGHDQSEGEATGAYGNPGYAIDVLNAVAALERHPQVNPEKIGMWGHSMGGYLTLRAMVVSPDIRVGVIWAGVVSSYPDMLMRWRRSGSETSTPVPAGPRRWRNAWEEEFGSVDENPVFWASISSNSYLADISGPLQLHHGTLDESVPLELSQILYEEMLKAGKPVELYVYEGDNHNLSNSFSDAMYRTIKFFDAYLKP